MRTIMYLVALACVFAVIGTVGALECDTITVTNAIVRTCILLPVGLGAVLVAKRI